MAKRTSVLSLFPRHGGLVTSIDPSLLQPGQLVQADGLIFDYQESIRRREGIDNAWDSADWTVEGRSSTSFTRTLTGEFNTGFIVGDLISIEGAGSSEYNGTLMPITAISDSSLSYTAQTEFEEDATTETSAEMANKVVGGIDYWLGSVESKAQYLISVLDNGAVFRTEAGTRTRILDGGKPWSLASGPLTEANLEIYNNRVFIGVSHAVNRVKYWDGVPANPMRDLMALLYEGTAPLESVSRASTGTTRTLIFNENVSIQDGDPVIIISDNTDYAGSFVVASGGGTTTITYEADTALEETTTPDEGILIGADAPHGLYIKEHIGSLWMNDKNALDNVHYSGPGNHLAWGGFGDSGGYPIGFGDGDPAGVTGLAPFKGNLFVGKRTKLYRLAGTEPDTLNVIKISDGIGFLSHQGVVSIDQDDLFFVSYRGIHSMAATDAYGDFSSVYVSKDIQKSFVEDWNEGRKRFIKAAYLPEINSAVFAVTERGSRNNNLYLYNIQYKYWYRWPGVEAETLITAQDQDRRRLYLGGYSGRLGRTLTGENVDTDAAGVQTTIQLMAKTGILYMDGRPDTVKGVKRLALLLRAQGSYSITAKVKVDNFSEQAVGYISNALGDVLGQFVLGESVLGGSYVTAPYSQPVDGYGRGIQITLQQNDRNIGVALQGLMVEYEGGGDSPETRLGDDK